MPNYSMHNLPFSTPSNDWWFYFKSVFREKKFKSVYKQFNRGIRRPWSRSIIKRFAPDGWGLELGVGAKTIAPVRRTILSDAFESHGVSDSIAQMYFTSDSIPFDDHTFAFILSEHMLEHLANPVKTLKEIERVLKTRGVLFLFLPHKERTFDRFRERTALQHLLNDYELNTPDSDTTHLADFRENVISKNLLPEHYNHLTDEELINSGSLHHHVWVETDMAELLTHLGWQILYTVAEVPDRTDSFLIVAESP